MSSITAGTPTQTRSSSSIGDVTELTAESSQLDALRDETWEQFLDREERRPGFERGEGPYCVRGVRLPGMVGTLSRPCQPELTFAHEIAGRVRVIATLDQAPVLLHSDAWPDYPGSVDELSRMRKALKCEADDALVVIRGATEDTITAAREIQLRYADAVEGIPHETRQPLEGGHTDFERILPGPDRMYPDTDSPPQRPHSGAGREPSGSASRASLAQGGALWLGRCATEHDLLSDPSRGRQTRRPCRRGVHCGPAASLFLLR